MSPAHALFAELSRIPPAAVARCARRLPPHVDQADLLAAANVALYETVLAHWGKPREDVERLACVRCYGAVKDELRRNIMIRGARRNASRARMVPFVGDENTQLSTQAEEPAMIFGRVTRAINALPPRWKRVFLARLVDTDVKMLATELKVTEARISQLYTLSVERIRRFVAQAPTTPAPSSGG